jgi:hypothetical protein
MAERVDKAGMSQRKYSRSRAGQARRRPSIKRKGGQALLEFVVTAGLLLACVAMLALLLYTFKEHGGRVLGLIASEYP